MRIAGASNLDAEDMGCRRGERGSGVGAQGCAAHGGCRVKGGGLGDGASADGDAERRRADVEWSVGGEEA